MMWMLRRRRKMMMLRGKTDRKTGKHTLCEPARSKCTRAILRGNLQGKCRTPSPRHPFCASLLNQNAHGHVAKGILCKKIPGKGQTPRIPPRLNTGPYTYRKNPSVWTRCLGNKELPMTMLTTRYSLRERLVHDRQYKIIKQFFSYNL